MANATPYQATLNHLELLIRKRNRLEDAITDATEVLYAQLQRADVSLDECGELYQWAKQWRRSDEHGRPIPAAPHKLPTRIAQALGFKDHAHLIGEMRRQKVAYETRDRLEASGDFPVDRQWAPRRGVPCVYMLFAGDQLIYVGRSEQVKTRLKAHWRTREEKPGLSSWRVMVTPSLEKSKLLEAELIARYSPKHNRAGNRYRNVA